MESIIPWWLTYLLYGLPLLAWTLWSWNDLRFLAQAYFSSTKLPPGHMGFPFIGELLIFLWYFKVVRQPDGFITSKRKRSMNLGYLQVLIIIIFSNILSIVKLACRYGDGVGIYRTNLFGSPSIIGCSPSFNKFVLQSEDIFSMKWPSSELFGRTSLVVVEGNPHARLRNYVLNSISRPDALRKVANIVQPLLVSKLRSWADKGRVTALKEVKKVTLQNICSMFVSFKPGPLLDMIEKYVAGVLGGVRAQPLNIPGTSFRHGVQCRKKLLAIFRTELENRKLSNEDKYDLMEGFMRMKDEEGKFLSDEEVVDNIISLVMAGYESTSLASMWALYYLAKSPDVLQKLRVNFKKSSIISARINFHIYFPVLNFINNEMQEENLGVGRKADYLTSDDLSKLKYTNKVVEETIRMANIAPFIFRVVKKQVTYKGYNLPIGWNIIVWLRGLHTDPKNFEDPMSFNPDRWNTPAKPGTYQVFGGGPRICAGNMLARIQVTIFLHHLVTSYKWQLVNPDAKMVYLPHPKPVDGVEITFSTL
ncbi:ent-kaurenoic acid monooxygenase [Ranunculus cassubicifolius]